MIAFKDFVPKPLQTRLRTSSTPENLREAVQAANQWMEANGIRPLNVETILLPGRSVTTSLAIAEEHEERASTRWTQFVPVWNEAK